MDRRKTGFIALTATGVLAASAAVVLSVPTTGTLLAADENVAAQAIAPTNLWGTNVVLPEGYVAFYLDGAGTLASYGDTSDFDQTTLDGITAQLQAAPPMSALIVDTDSLDADGLTTVLTTVTPTNGMSIASTNEAMQQWLVALFPGVEGTVASQDIPNVPNASFTTTQTVDEVTWTVTDYVFQYGDATVSARLSTTDTTGETRAEVDQMLATQTR